METVSKRYGLDLIKLKLVKSTMVNKISGLLIAGLSLVLILRNLRLLYLYNYSDVLFNYMLPTPIIVIQIGLASCGLLIGFLIGTNRLKLNNGLLYSALIFLTFLIIEQLGNI